MTDYVPLRQRMVEHQIRPSEVTDRAVIDAFLEVPRELFVEPSERPFAYGDGELRMPASGGAERRMMAPVQLARLLQLMPAGAGAKIMTIGCGTGYSAALLSRLAGSVVGVEADERLAAAARDRLRAVGAANVTIMHGDMTEGYAAAAPYDGILIDGAIEVLPRALVEQLRPGGVMGGIERSRRTSRAMLWERVGEEAAKWPQFEAWAPLLPGFGKVPAFEFPT